MDSIGVRLKRHRTKHDLSLSHVARETGFCRPVVRSDEQGGDMPLSRLVAYARLYRCTVKAFVPDNYPPKD